MGAGVGDGDEGLGKLLLLASDAVRRAFNLDESIDSGVSTFSTIGNGDLRCFSMKSPFWHTHYKFQK